MLVDRWFGNSRLQYFARAEDPPLLETPFDYAPDLQLVSFGSRSGQAAAGEDFLPVRLHFMSKSNQYRFSLRLLDSNNRPVDEIDGQIPGGNEIVRVGIPLSRTLPPGEFAAQLGIYRSGSSQPLTFSDGMNELVLSRVTVSRPQ